MTPTQKTLKEALLATGWMHPEVEVEDSLFDLGFDSLALALWVMELERSCQIKIPLNEATLEQFETIEQASRLVEPLLRK